MTKTILILGAGRSQLPAIAVANKMGFTTIAIDPDPNALGKEISNYFYTHDLASDDCIEIAKKHEINGVITLAADYPVPMLARICEELDLPGLSSRSAELSTNKKLMRERFSSANLPSPKSIPVSGLSEAVDVMRNLATDIIVKPAKSSGGRGITFITKGCSNDEFTTAFNRARSLSQNNEILIESFIEGPEFSVEMLHHSGVTTPLNVTDKITSGPPYFVETGHSQPSRLAPEIASEIIELAISATKSLEIDNAPSHTEIRLSSDGPYLIETAARMGGGFIASHLVPLSSGINFVEATIEVAIGRKPGFNRKEKVKGAAIKFIPYPIGIFKGISNMNSLLKMPGINEICIYIKPGDKVLPLTDATSRIGHIICHGKDANSALMNVTNVINNIKAD